MKKILILALVIVFSINAGFCATKKSVKPVKKKPVSAQTGYISVSASKSEDVSPNIAKVIFYIESENKDQTKAVGENKKAAINLISAVKNKINPETDTVKTLNYSVSPMYNYSKDNKRIFDKYRVNNSIEVKIKNPKNMGAIIDAAIKAGATRVGSLDYSLDLDEYDCSALIKGATATAKTRARALSQSLGVNIVGIKQINANCSSDDSGPYMARMTYNSADGTGGNEGESLQQEGVIKVTVTVDAQFWVR